MDRYIATHSIRKLHVGCGGNIFETWLNTDLEGNNKNIVTLDVAKPFPIPPATFDYIYSEHLIEHLSFSQQVNYLKESFRILRTGGRVRIATPDFEFLMKLGQEQKTDFQKVYLDWNARTFLKNIPGELVHGSDAHVYVINNYFRDWGHQLIHGKSSLANLLKFCGFSQLKFQNVGKSDDPQLTTLEHHGAMITESYNEFETMVIEGVKPGNSKN